MTPLLPTVAVVTHGVARIEELLAAVVVVLLVGVLGLKAVQVRAARRRRAAGEAYFDRDAARYGQRGVEDLIGSTVVPKGPVGHPGQGAGTGVLPPFDPTQAVAHRPPGQPSAQ
jgi:hypothetical protein